MANENEGKGSPVLMRGWHFSSQEYQEAWQSNRLLTASIELSNLCDLNCEYCFRAETYTKEKRRLPGEISVDDTKRIIDDLASLGCKAVNIIGAGEPTVDPALPKILHYLSDRSIIPVLSTHGAKLEGLIEDLQETGSSVVVKGNSFNQSVQNRMVRREGYAEKRDNGLKLLIERGFNLPYLDAQTRLGVNSIVYQANKSEVLDILRFCRNSNIMPIMATFIPTGRTKSRTDMEISMNEFIELSKKAREIDKNEFGIAYERLWPYFGGIPCTQCGKASIYVTILGDIFECPGQTSNYGNIKNNSIKDAFAKIVGGRGNKELACPPRRDYWKRTGQME